MDQSVKSIVRSCGADTFAFLPDIVCEQWINELAQMSSVHIVSHPQTDDAHLIDIKTFVKEHPEDVLIANLDSTGPSAWPVVRLGARCAYMRNVSHTGLSLLMWNKKKKDIPELLGEYISQLLALDELDCAEEDIAQALLELHHDFLASQDVTSVLAHFLSCHPYVHELFYPGLKHLDQRQFSIGASQLIGGFGNKIHLTVQEQGSGTLTIYPHDVRSSIVKLDAALAQGRFWDVAQELDFCALEL